MSEISLSILTPIYNVKDDLPRMIQSVLQQEYTDFELILSDDGSTDGSGELCDHYASLDDRIVVLHYENGGVSEARNRALRAARGRYIGFVDSDDTIQPNMFKRLMELAEAYNADIVQCKHNRTEGVTSGTGDVRVMDGRQMLDEMLTVARSGWYTNIVALWSKIYKADIIKDIVFPKGRTYEDEAKMPEILLRAKTLVETDEELYHYIFRPSSIIGHWTFKKQCDKAVAIRERIDYIRTVDEKYYVPTILAYYYLVRSYLVENASNEELSKNEYSRYFIDMLLKDKKLLKRYVNKYERLNLFLFALKSDRINKWLISQGLEPVQELLRKIKK